jgi:hypothetical protein
MADWPLSSHTRRSTLGSLCATAVRNAAILVAPAMGRGSLPDPREARLAFAAVGDQHRVPGEQVGELIEVAAHDRLEERLQHSPVLLGRRDQRPPLHGHVVASAPQQLPAGRLALLDQRRDLAMAEVEDVVEEEHGPLGGREPLKHDQEGHRDLVEPLDAANAPITEADGLGQSIAPALLAPRPRRVELVQAQASHDLEQVAPGIVDGHVAPLPAEPRLLHGVLGAPAVTEHPVRERHERGPAGLEGSEIVRHENPISRR